ncbi:MULTISPECIES: recombinase family protein [unclassified Pseudomonas]|uniref:recombinase family protein n=1 Tax=unclassified Pseudomonas TaxID=196821 RepID=UPI00161BDC82|nr:MULTISPECIES: recombinase family protein [unclassified Pseudomonas]MBB6289786.1 DNA invertase Pin-like site-specific DNA recombinase [Pseudomonas sp. SJZ073]MBB6314894.1 DNA invertase Pin-like site-specific DNA recombinase [Pseudomonas sp. JAI120]
MLIHAYLRASTADQDANRAKQQLKDFAAQHGHSRVLYYMENVSGASLQRPELFRLLEVAEPGDVLLVEQVDRLSRLTEGDWQQLRTIIKAKGVKVVSLDLPTSHMAMAPANTNNAADAFTGRVIEAVNAMLLDMLAAVARKDYEDRIRRQRQGIEKAKEEKRYQGKSIDQDKHRRILACLGKGMSIRETAETTGTSTSTVIRAKKLDKESVAG